MTYDHDNLIQGDDPIAILSHDQKIQFSTARYLGNVKWSRRNANKVN